MTYTTMFPCTNIGLCAGKELSLITVLSSGP
nr:MAG TPA_asm: hypothetical protein [Caudoviricetes sp.]